MKRSGARCAVVGAAVEHEESVDQVAVTQEGDLFDGTSNALAFVEHGDAHRDASLSMSKPLRLGLGSEAAWCRDRVAHRASTLPGTRRAAGGVVRHGRHLRSARPVIHRKVVSQMSVDVRIPTTLRTLTGGANKVTVEGSTVSEVLAALDAGTYGIDPVTGEPIDDALLAEDPTRLS